MRRLAFGGSVVVAAAIAGCGGGSDEATRQQEIQAERAEAAQIARQDERIHQLEDEAKGEGEGIVSTATGEDGDSAEATTEAAPAGENDSWPAGFGGWTVVLGSSSSRAEAESIAAEAVDAGLPQVGVLYSSNYSTLNDGYWVTYTGVLDGRPEARERQHLARTSGFHDAYAREVAE
jgi:hypothetical protein